MPVRDAFTRLSEALSERYRIERELGQGGMATVYLAEDLKHDRKVAVEHSATVSPDRRLGAYASEEDGAYRGYVREWPGLGRKALVTGGDTLSAYKPAFRWARGSRELYYVRASGELAVVTVGADGSPSSWRTVTGLGTAWLQDLDTVGNRFLVKRSALGAATPDGLPEPNRLMLLTNFTGELRRRMGEGG